MALISFYNPATRYKWFNTAWIISLLIFPVLLWMLPSDFFDNTGVDICPSKLLFNYECFGCGMTRAVMHMHHLEWRDALLFNYGIVIVYPALVFFWLRWLLVALKRNSNFKKKN
jgi:hypothetical protein